MCVAIGDPGVRLSTGRPDTGLATYWSALAVPCHSTAWPQLGALCRNRFDRCGSGSVSASGLGRVETRHRACSGCFLGMAVRNLFQDFDYARIAVMSGWMPMMFMTRVRL